MASAMGRVTLSHLMDRNLYPFTTLEPTGHADPAGDKAFDEDEACDKPSAVEVPVQPMLGNVRKS